MNPNPIVWASKRRQRMGEAIELIPGLIGLEDEEESGTVKHHYDKMNAAKLEASC